MTALGADDLRGRTAEEVQTIALQQDRQRITREGRLEADNATLLDLIAGGNRCTTTARQ